MHLLIEGENLAALRWLPPRCAGAVKFIYIDPPYNTGGASLAYHDRRAPEAWLAFLRARLAAAVPLLKADGAIAVQLNKDELCHCKVMMDDLLGRERFVTMITWQRASQRTLLGQGRVPVVDITEHILLYAMDGGAASFNKIRKEIPIEPEGEGFRKLSSQYRHLFLSEGERALIKTVTTARGAEVKIFRHENWRIAPVERRAFRNDLEGLYYYYGEHFDALARYDHQQQESSVERSVLAAIDDPECLYSATRVMPQGKRKGEEKTTYYHRGNVIYRLRDYAALRDGRIYRLVDLNTLWTDAEVSAAGIAAEGGVELKRGKKPEALLKILIELCSREGDLVLDFFAGSGTTAAVAHKLRRQWIAVEQLPEMIALCRTRLANVVAGEQSGISKAVGWQGGGEWDCVALEECGDASAVSVT